MGLRLDGGDVEGVQRGGGRADGGEEDGGRRCRGQQALRPTVHRFRPRFFSLSPIFPLLFLSRERMVYFADAPRVRAPATVRFEIDGRLRAG